MTPLKGEVWLVNLDPRQGHEQAKTRHCVVLSNDPMNTKIGLSIIIPFTGTGWFTKSSKLSPIMVEVIPPDERLTKPSYSMAHQVRTMSQTRFKERIGQLSGDVLRKIISSVQEIID